MNIDFLQLEQIARNFTARDKSMSKAESYDLAIKAIQMAATIEISNDLKKIESHFQMQTKKS